MRIGYFTENAYDDLYDSISKNVDCYKSIDNTWLKEWSAKIQPAKESRIDVTTLPVLDVNLGDAGNAIAIHNVLKDKINHKQASNVYLWSYLTHFNYWDYSIKRWGNEDINEEMIKAHFFCITHEGTRRGFLRNSISRLWWAAELTYQPDKPDPYELTKVLFSNQDIYQSIAERNFSMCNNVIIGILSAIKEINDDPDLEDVGVSKKYNEREWRMLCKYINRFGAVTLLETFTAEEIKQMSYNYILESRK